MAHLGEVESDRFLQQVVAFLRVEIVTLAVVVPTATLRLVTAIEENEKYVMMVVVVVEVGVIN